MDSSIEDTIVINFESSNMQLARDSDNLKGSYSCFGNKEMSASVSLSLRYKVNDCNISSSGGISKSTQYIRKHFINLLKTSSWDAY